MPIDRILPWNVTEKVVNGKIQRSLVHDKCYKQFRKQQN